jgi:transposase InsO family protein
MTAQDRIVKNKMSLIELAEYLQNVSEACKIHGVSRQHFYDIKKADEENGLEGLKDKTRRKPCIKNRVAPETEEAVLRIAYEKPAYGQLRASNELRKQGVLVSAGGVRSIWQRYNIETFDKRLKKLEEKAAKEGILYTEDQLAALEKAQQEKNISIDEIDTQHPGYLLAQDTFYVGYIKGVGRIYQQTAIDTYSAVGFAKLYTAKVPVTAADILNDRVLPFFENHMIPVMRVLTDRGTEYCGAPEKHLYELFLQMNDIEHTMTKAKSPQTNGICERFNQTILNEFYKPAFRRTMYKSVEQMQEDLDFYMLEYNEERTHQGKRCKGRTPMQTFLDSLSLARENILNDPAS